MAAAGLFSKKAFQLAVKRAQYTTMHTFFVLFCALGFFKLAFKLLLVFSDAIAMSSCAAVQKFLYRVVAT